MTEAFAHDAVTERLRVRPYREHDLGHITRLLTDERTTLHYPRPFTQPDAEAWLERAMDAHAADGTGMHALELRDGGGYVGHCGPMWQEVDGRCILEVGWMVLPDLWGRGYAPEAAAWWHRELPRRFGVAHTASIIGPDNVKSARVAAKLGLERGPATTYKGVDVELWTRTFDVPEPELRPARVADARGIAFAHVRCWQFAYREMLPQELLDRLDVAARATHWERLLGGEGRLPGACCIVAVRGDVVLGFVDVGLSRDADASRSTHELYAIYLRPDQIGTGNGARLLAAAADSARESGAERMTLWALEGNERAARAYRRAGWAPDGAAKVEQVGLPAGVPIEVPHVRWAIEL